VAAKVNRLLAGGWAGKTTKLCGDVQKTSSREVEEKGNTRECSKQKVPFKSKSIPGPRTRKKKRGEKSELWPVHRAGSAPDQRGLTFVIRIGERGSFGEKTRGGVA